MSPSPWSRWTCVSGRRRREQPLSWFQSLLASHQVQNTHIMELLLTETTSLLLGGHFECFTIFLLQVSVPLSPSSLLTLWGQALFQVLSDHFFFAIKKNWTLGRIVCISSDCFSFFLPLISSPSRSKAVSSSRIDGALCWRPLWDLLCLQVELVQPSYLFWWPSCTYWPQSCRDLENNHTF